MKRLLPVMMMAVFGWVNASANEGVYVVGGMAPMGDANAWVEAQSRTAHEGQSNYKSKYLAVAPALNHGGVFPTCVAMVLMYHNDQLGLFPSHIRDFLSPEGQSLIASPEYFADYYLPDDSATVHLLQDKSGPLGNKTYNWITRADNCIADRCLTSQSFIGLISGMSVITGAGDYYSLNLNYNGQVIQILSDLNNSGSRALYWLGKYIDESRQDVPAGFSHLGSFLELLDYESLYFWDKEESDTTASEYYWRLIQEEVDARRPLIALIKQGPYSEVMRIAPTVTVVGYAEDPVRRAFAAYNGQSMEMQWYFLEDMIQGIIPFNFDVEGFEPGQSALEGNVVHRFYNPTNGAYFFTAFESEAQAVVDNNPVWEYQGPVFEVEYGPAEGNLPVYRFLNTKVGAHFFTMNEAEKASVIANLSHQYQYEGVAFYARADQLLYDPSNPSGVASYPIWRCYLPQTSSHYFTASKAEVDYIQEHVDRSLIYVEGVAWYSGRIFDVP